MVIGYMYGLAAEFGVKALAICTVSDQIISGERLTVEERQSSFNEMIELALETAVAEEIKWGQTPLIMETAVAEGN